MNKIVLRAVVCTALLASTSAVFANADARLMKESMLADLPKEHIRMQKVVYRNEDRLVVMRPVYRPGTMRVLRPVYKPHADKMKIRNLKLR